jgi:hypothetical protein
MTVACTPDSSSASTEASNQALSTATAPRFDAHCIINQGDAPETVVNYQLGATGGDDSFSDRQFDVGGYPYTLQGAHYRAGDAHVIHFAFDQAKGGPVDPNALGGVAENQAATVGAALHFVTFRGAFKVECYGALTAGD